MEKYYKRKSLVDPSQPSNVLDSNVKKTCTSIDSTSLPSDPGLRPSIWSYNVNERDEYRRVYLQKGHSQPRNHDFPYTLFGKDNRRFNPDWFESHPTWLEYNVEKDAVFCLYCYLFKPDSHSSHQGGGGTFVSTGFNNWKKKEKIWEHVGKHNSAHNEARQKCEDLMKQKQSISSMFISKTAKDKSDYRVLLTAAVDCVRFLLRQGLPFRGHDESEKSRNQGNYLSLFHFLAEHNEEVRKVSFSNASGNLQLTSPKVQKDICHAASIETLNAIIKDLGDSYFSILVDESRDVAIQEQMVVALRYVDKNGDVIERFFGVEHVTSTTAASLKEALDALLARHNLSISRIRGQGYDGASNMQGKLSGLKTLILKENPSAFYVHCFAHQLQLALVAVARKHFEVKALFEFVMRIVNTVGASCKRNDTLKAIQHDKILEALNNEDLVSGRGLNQETSLKRSGDTRWGSYYYTLIRLRYMYSSVIEVLEIIMEDGINDPQSVEASVLLDVMQSFDFIFSMHVMIKVLGVTNELSQTLQRKDQDIENAMKLVQLAKERLQMTRVEDEEWESLLNEISSFCNKFEVEVPNMEEKFKARGRPKRGTIEKSNLDRYRFELFNTIIDLQLMELNDRFSETTTDLLLCVGALNPSNSFAAFNKEKLLRLAELYPTDFSPLDVEVLRNELETYIRHMRSTNAFSKLHGIASLAKKMAATRTNLVYQLVYRLITLALTLPVATATVERAFSAIKIVKTRLRNRLGDEWLTDCLIPYIEKEVFDEVSNEDIIKYYQNMKTRMKQL